MSSGRDVIFIEGARLFGYIGVFPEEKRKGQNYLLDVELGLDLARAGKSDQLQDTVSYAEVFELAKQLMSETRCDLLETYAERLSVAIFESFSLVESTKVTIRKPDAPIDGEFRSVGVSIQRRRDG